MALDPTEFTNAMAVYLANTDLSIALRRGLESNLPSGLLQGEPYYATDTEIIYVGNGDGTSTAFLTEGSADATFAPLASPSLTGTPVAPTAAASTDTTQIATTAFVHDAVANDLNASGSAPMYACRAWCEFDGTLTGTNAPTAGGNVTSVVRNSTGDYTINFTTALPDGNYAAVFGATQSQPSNSSNHVVGIKAGGTDQAPSTKSTTALQIIAQTSGGAEIDLKTITVAVFR